jgi:hypothetical protein
MKNQLVSYFINNSVIKIIYKNEILIQINEFIAVIKLQFFEFKMNFRMQVVH